METTHASVHSDSVAVKATIVRRLLAIASVGLFVMGLGVAVLGGGAAVKLPVSIAGIAIMFIGIFMWAHEGNEGYHIHPNKEDL